VIDGKRAADFGLAVIGRLGELGGLCGLRLGEVGLEHRLDPRRRSASLEPRHHALLDHEGKRRHLIHAEALGEVRPVVHVDLAHAETAASLRAMWASRLSIRRAGPER
jgi:hypothetical protein